MVIITGFYSMDLMDVINMKESRVVWVNVWKKLSKKTYQCPILRRESMKVIENEDGNDSRLNGMQMIVESLFNDWTQDISFVHYNKDLKKRHRKREI